MLCVQTIQTFLQTIKPPCITARGLPLAVKEALGEGVPPVLVLARGGGYLCLGPDRGGGGQAPPVLVLAGGRRSSCPGPGQRNKGRGYPVLTGVPSPPLPWADLGRDYGQDQ